MNGKRRFEIAEGKIRFIVMKQDAATVVEVYDKDDSPAIGTTSRPSSTPESKPRYGISDPGEEPQYKKTKVVPTRVPTSVPSSSMDQMSWL